MRADPQTVGRQGGPVRRILLPGVTCQAIEPASRAAVLIDNQAYFAAARQAILAARRSVMLLGWCFDPRTRLEPDDHGPEAMGRLLVALAEARRDLEISILSWDMALPIAVPRSLYPQRAKFWFRKGPVDFRLDGAPLGACHHQKLLVVDDAIAFCSSSDFLPNRWDTTEHRDDEPRRRLPPGLPAPPVHEVTLLVEGPVAAALGALARARWRRATGETLPAPAPDPLASPWPAAVAPDFRRIGVGIARTEPAAPPAPATREAGALNLQAIAAAQRFLYLENQYLTSAEIVAALAARLAEPDGPEIVLVCPLRAPSYFDRVLMDRPRAELVARLRAQDRFGRLRVYIARTAGGRPITIHSKLTIVDDRLLRIGSSNLNNRSVGLDTECDLAIEADDDATRQGIRGVRDRLLAHFLGCAPARVAAETERTGSLIRAIEAIDPAARRLSPLERPMPGPIGRLVARYELGDPHGLDDVFRPWRRVAARQACLQRLARG